MKQHYFLFWVLFGFLIGTSYATVKTKPIICTQEYALCTSAPCIPDPGHPDYAICSCVVKKGDSAGYKTCEKRTPNQGAFKVETNYFNFFIQTV